jgi:hypothetical protein
MASKPASSTGPAADGVKGSKQKDLSSFFSKSAKPKLEDVSASGKRSTNTMEDATNLPSKQDTNEVGLLYALHEVCAMLTFYLIWLIPRPTTSHSNSAKG